MKLRTFFVCGCLLTLCSTSLFAAKTQANTTPSGPSINVLLEKEAPSAFLEAKGRYRVTRKDNGAVLSHGSVGKRFVVHALQDGLRWGEEYPDIYQISLVPLSEDTVVYVNGIQYKGAISIYHVNDNRITIINEVPIEDFLKSTLAIQFDELYSKEALSALVVVARTDAYNRVLKGLSSTCPWDITADAAEYYGHGVTLRQNGVDEAVDWSRFMIVESMKTNQPLPTAQLAPSKAEELANQGLDTQRIIQTAFPYTKIGVTISADEVAIR